MLTIVNINDIFALMPLQNRQKSSFMREDHSYDDLCELPQFLCDPYPVLSTKEHSKANVEMNQRV